MGIDVNITCSHRPSTHPNRPRGQHCWQKTSRKLSRRSSTRAAVLVAAIAEKSKVKLDEEVILTEVNGKWRRNFPSQQQTARQEPLSKQSQSSTGVNSVALDFAKSFILPKGYPATVTDDYLDYQLKTLPAHITGWMSKSLATSSLIQALGVGSVAPSGAVAATAAIKWITKDGLGAFGRFLVGGRLGGVFDEDPRRWRMIAVGFATLGLALEIATTAFPSYFIALASAGNFTKAVGKGLSQPCFRIIQNHFAASNNLGDISAKEEVWEVSAQLLGLASSVTLLRAIEAGGKPETVLWVWGIVQVIHVGLRYNSLASLRFAELNQKRACLLVSAHVRGRPLPGVREANEAEPILAGPSGVAPHVELGVGVERAFAGNSPSAQRLLDLRQVYAGEHYWLIWREGRGYAMLEERHTPEDLLKLLWQAAWLDAQGVIEASVDDYGRSLAAVSHNWANFQQELAAQRWEPGNCAYRLGEQRIEWRLPS